MQGQYKIFGGWAPQPPMNSDFNEGTPPEIPRNSMPISPRHIQAYTGISPGSWAFRSFILFKAFLTSSSDTFSTTLAFASACVCYAPLGFSLFSKPSNYSFHRFFTFSSSINTSPSSFLITLICWTSCLCLSLCLASLNSSLVPSLVSNLSYSSSYALFFALATSYFALFFVLLYSSLLVSSLEMSHYFFASFFVCTLSCTSLFHHQVSWSSSLRLPTDSPNLVLAVLLITLATVSQSLCPSSTPLWSLSPWTYIGNPHLSVSTTLCVY